MAVKRGISPKQLFVCLVLFVAGLVLGYYLGYDHGFEKVDKTNSQQPTTVVTCDALTNISPKPEEKVTSPLTITVTVDNTKSCKWAVFEAQAGVALLSDSTGRKIGSTTLTTTEDWMTEQPVVYTGTIEFTQTPASNKLLLEIFEERTSDLAAEENGQSISIPLTY